MVVGLCRVVLALPWNDSLKGKRSVVKSILERTRRRFQVAASEVADHDVHRRATLGFALVSNDVRHARSVLDKLVSFVAGATPAELVGQTLRVEHVDLVTGARALSDLTEDDSDNDFELDQWVDDGGDEEEG